jgi:hypothetical protein
VKNFSVYAYEKDRELKQTKEMHYTPEKVGKIVP